MTEKRLCKKILLESSKTREITIKIVPGLGIYCKFFYLVQGFSVENDTLKNGTFRAAQYGSAPPPPPGPKRTRNLINATYRDKKFEKQDLKMSDPGTWLILV